MKISVVTISYNAADLIETTIKSVLSQTYTDVEYVVIDGGSSDGTTEIIKRYSDRIAYWISEPDKGIYDAMNKGIIAATGDYINFMNAGDTFSDENVIERLAPLLNGETVVYGKWYRCYANGVRKLVSPNNIKVLRFEMPFCHQAAFVDLHYHKKHLFDTSYRYSADYDFFYKAWRNNMSFLSVEDIITDFLEGGVSGNNFSSTIKEREMSWEGEQNLLFRQLHLRYQILRIKTVKLIKKIYNHKA